MFIFIDLVSYVLIAEEFFFVLTDMDFAVVALETAVVMVQVRSLTRSERTIWYMTAVASALASLYSSSFLLLVLLPLVLLAS